MVQSLTKPLTLDEFLKLPETEPESEYIDGEIIQKHIPQGKHSRIQGKLVTTIENLATTVGEVVHAEVEGRSRTTQPRALAFPELRCTFAGRSIVPDVVVLPYDRIPRDEKGEIANIFTGSPDWMIEILSPDQNLLKVTKKMLHCLKNGTVLGWLIIPEDHSIFVYHQEKTPELLENDEEVLPVPNFLPEFTLTVGDVFGWLKL